MPRAAADITTTTRLVDVIDALRADLEDAPNKAVATEALIDKLTVYLNGVEPADGDHKHAKRRVGRPVSDSTDRLRVNLETQTLARPTFCRDALFPIPGG
jgi:hypothetical protein